MLLQFKVENYKSIKEEAVLSLEASADKEHLENTIKEGKANVLKSIAIFGANASGKSNLFLALTAALLTIRESNLLQVDAPLRHIVPFKFDSKCLASPTAFELVFIAGGQKYVYGFSATRARIMSEYLYVYKSAKPTSVFKRKADEYEFTTEYIRQFKPVVERNASNKLFLATATAWNCEETKTPLLWLTSGINTYSNDYAEVLNVTGQMFEYDDDSSLKRFTTAFLHEADINISDYSLETSESSPAQIQKAISDGFQGIFSGFPVERMKEYRIKTMHEVDESGAKTRYSLDFGEESQGTRSLFLLSPIVKRAFETGEVLFIDEFDASLHPLLVKYIVGLFHDKNINKANAQLVISSHTTELLDLNELRRDQVYFMDKDRDTGASQLYSLDEFSERKGSDIRKAYLLGRYDAVPSIGLGVLEC
ncbi:MAG: ATP-binding protein [Sphaerochaetaceae bacterium]|jgi:AAA15 family ATPase/GTPase